MQSKWRGGGDPWGVFLSLTDTLMTGSAAAEVRYRLLFKIAPFKEKEKSFFSKTDSDL